MAEMYYNNYESAFGDTVNPYQQNYSDTCAIKSQQLILKDYGIDLTEDQLVQYSKEQGWYNGNGTLPSDVGKILVDAGIPCTQTEGANIYDLTNELAQGHRVIVSVDSGELWNNGILDWLKDLFLGGTPDHALIVAGLDMSDPNNPMVILTDPGTGEPAAPYPLDQFMDAWADSKGFMVSTNVPTPEALNTFIQNGLSEMHLPEIADVNYDTFHTFQDYSHQINPDYLSDLNTMFHSFQEQPNQDFNTALNDNGLPSEGISFQPFVYNPTPFDYNNILDTSWCSQIEDESSSSGLSDLQKHNLDILNDCLDTATEQAQNCLDNGSYISSTIWQQQAHDIQNQIDDIMHDC